MFPASLVKPLEPTRIEEHCCGISRVRGVFIIALNRFSTKAIRNGRYVDMANDISVEETVTPKK